MIETYHAADQLTNLVKEGNKVFLIGIGGVGMSALATVLKARGLDVRGSDVKRGKITNQLESLGIKICISHDAEHIQDEDFVVFSSAISKINPEFEKAGRLQIPIYHRAQILAYLMSQAISLAVTGTHGKTTSASFTSYLLKEAGFDPTCLVGGEVLNFGSNVIIGDPHLIVAEVDESDQSQLQFSPDFALITNLDSDHMDVYHDVGNLKKSFKQFVEQVKSTGCVIYCHDDMNIRDVMSEAKSGGSNLSYGLSTEADFYAKDVTVNGFGSSYHLYEHGKKIDLVQLTIPGIHNVLNSLGVIAMLRRFGLRYDQILPHILEFRGAGRRLQIKLQRNDLLVIDDYAHHPTEVNASLKALRDLGRKVTAVFQPHRYSRTAYLAQEFSNAFHCADRVLLTDIYAAGEENKQQVKSSLIYQAVKQSGHPDVQMIGRNEIVEFLMSHRSSNDVIAFLGAGDIGELADEFANRCKTVHSI